MKQIDIDQFCKDVSESPTLNNIHGTVNEFVDRYSIGLRTLLDNYTSCCNGKKTCTVFHNHPNVWGLKQTIALTFDTVSRLRSMLHYYPNVGVLNILQPPHF